MSRRSTPAERAFLAWQIEQEGMAKARAAAAEQDRAGDEERQVRAVEAEFVHARSDAERMELLIRATKAEFDRSCGHVERFAGQRRSIVDAVVAVVTRAGDLLDRLYERRDAGGTLRGREWADAFADLARIRTRLSDAEARMRGAR